MSADGTWNITVQTPMGAQTSTVELVTDGDFSGAGRHPSSPDNHHNSIKSSQEYITPRTKSCANATSAPSTSPTLTAERSIRSVSYEPSLANKFDVLNRLRAFENAVDASEYEYRPCSSPVRIWSGGTIQAESYGS